MALLYDIMSTLKRKKCGRALGSKRIGTKNSNNNLKIEQSSNNK